MATNNRKKPEAPEAKGQMSVREAGERGGERTAQTHGREFYEQIGHKGGQRVRQLIQEGKAAESSAAESTAAGSPAAGSAAATKRTSR